MKNSISENTETSATICYAMTNNPKQNSMKKIIKTHLALFLILAGLALASCEKVDDPFVDRVASPVLVKIDGAAQGDYSTDPTVTYVDSLPLSIGASVYELDKSGILDHTVGIDSIPVNALAVTLSTRSGTKIADLTTDNTGKAIIAKTWAELGLASPKKGNNIAMQWSGTHKGQTFTRYFRVQVK